MKKLAALLATVLLLGGLMTQSLAAQGQQSTPIFVGHKYTVHFAEGASFLLDFKTATTATFTYLDGPNRGHTEDITFTSREVGDGTYMLYWQERDGTTVVHVDDFVRMFAYTNITRPDHTFVNLSSRITTADGPGAPAAPARPTAGNEEQNRQIVTAFYEAALNQKDFEAARRYLGPTYRQHNPNAADGVKGFRAFIANLRTNSPNSHSQILRVAADGDLVVLHVHKTQGPNDRGVAIMDIFRLENGKIVEHWDVTQPVPERTASGNSMF